MSPDPRPSLRPVALLAAALLTLGLLAPLPAFAGQERASTEGERQTRRAEERASRRSAREQRRTPRVGAGAGIPGGEAEAGVPEERSTGQPPSPAPARAERTANAPDESTAGRREVAGRDCQLSAGVSSSVISAGETVAVLGRLLCQGGVSAVDQAVTLYGRSAGAHGFTSVATATSEADGSYQLAPAVFDSNSVFYVRCAGLRSKRVAVKVTPQITLAGSARDGAQLLAGGRGRSRSEAGNSTVTFSGTVSPAVAGTTVTLQREDAGINEGWRRIGRGEVDASGNYSLKHTFGAPGAVNVRVVVRHRGNLATASEPLSYVITRPQNPLLTIAGSSELIVSGETVTIDGVAAGAVKQLVTLVARDRAGRFAPVAQTTTDASGAYSFPAQSPLQSTAYRVTYATRTSTALPVRVTYALSATPAGETVEAGQPITFSGAALPGGEGQPVYLERRSPSGVGFHVLEAGTLGAGSTFSISHVFYNASDVVMRIKVPGASGYIGVGSKLFTIHVTPAPAATLVSQVPASSIVGEARP